MSTKKDKPEGWIDFQAIKQNVSFLTILEYYGLVDTFKRKGDSLTGPCPIHKGDSQTAFHVDLSKNIYKCFSRCKSMGFKGGGNIIDFVAEMEHTGTRPQDIKKAAELILEWTQGIEAGERPQRQTHPDSDEHKENKPLTFRLQLDPEHEYLKERELTSDTIEYFGLGYARKGIMKGRVCVPVHDERNNLIAYVGRATDEETAQKYGKYKNPPDFYKSLVLYNLNRVEKGGAVVLVEGYFGCFKIHQAGFPNVCSLMGWSMSEEQEKLILDNFKYVALMLDNDDAGKQGTKEILNRLYNKIFVRVIDLPIEKYQPDKLSQDEIQTFLSFLK
jgi:DNA primase